MYYIICSKIQYKLNGQSNRCLPIQKKNMRLTSHQGYRDFGFIKKMGGKI